MDDTAQKGRLEHRTMDHRRAQACKPGPIDPETSNPERGYAAEGPILTTLGAAETQ